MNDKEKRRLKQLFNRARLLTNTLRSECDYIDKCLSEIEKEWKLRNQSSEVVKEHI